MDQKMPATKDDDERVAGQDGEESISKPEDEKPPRKKRAAREEEDILEQYRDHIRAAGEERPNRTFDDKMKNIQYVLNPETETETVSEARIDLYARGLQKLDELVRARGGTPRKLKKRKLANNSTTKSHPDAASMMDDLTHNSERFNREKAELEDPTIPPHNFKVGDDVKMKYVNYGTLKISERANWGTIKGINSDGTVNIVVYTKSFGVEHASHVDKEVNPRTLRAYKRRKPRTTVRIQF